MLSTLQTSTIQLNQVINFNKESFEVIGYLGEGMTSKVYKAKKQDDFFYNIAIKHVMPEYSKEFLKEMVCLCQLNHPNIIKMVDRKLPKNGGR